MDKKDLIIELSLLLMDVEEEVIMDMINQITGDEDRIVFVPDVLH